MTTKARTKNRMRVGRGIGSGKGKTGGRGVKGQKSRSGVAIKGFEGGQMPLHVACPSAASTTSIATDLDEVNLGRIQQAIEAGKLDAKAHRHGRGAGRRRRDRRQATDGVKILGVGELKAKLTIQVAGASKSAVAAVEKAGGSVTILAAAVARGVSRSAYMSAGERSAEPRLRPRVRLA